MNNAAINASKSNCIFLEPSTSPSRYFSTKSWVSLGHTLARTDITPCPPNDNRGTIESSFPEYIAKSSGTKLAISATCPKSPLASLTATILGTWASSAIKRWRYVHTSSSRNVV